MDDLEIMTTDELKALAESINASHQTAVDSYRLCLEHGQKAIQAAISAGENLIKAKETLEHGKWLPWLAEHCKDISERTCQRYMDLAKASQVTDLSKTETLRQAYLKCGIIKTGKERPAEEMCPIRKAVKRLMDALEEECAMGEPDPEICETLQPVIDWYNTACECGLEEELIPEEDDKAA